MLYIVQVLKSMNKLAILLPNSSSTTSLGPRGIYSGKFGDLETPVLRRSLHFNTSADYYKKGQYGYSRGSSEI